MSSRSVNENPAAKLHQCFFSKHYVPVVYCTMYSQVGRVVKGMSLTKEVSGSIQVGGIFMALQKRIFLLKNLKLDAVFS